MSAPMKRDRVEIYLSADEQYRWRRVARNGEIIADSGESYTRPNDALRAARRTNGPDVDYRVKD